MSCAQRINVIGAGPAGLLAAALLARQRSASAIGVFERRLCGEQAGLGIILHQDTLAALARVAPDLSLAITASAVPISEISVRLRAERALHPAGQLYSLARATLIRLLTEACASAGVQLHYGCENLEPLQLPQANLTLVASGAASSLRSRYAAGFQPEVTAHGGRYLWLHADMPLRNFCFDFAQTGAGIATLHAYPYSQTDASIIIEVAQPGAAALLDGLPTGDALLRHLSTLFHTTLGGHALRLHGPGATVSWLQFQTVMCRQWLHIEDGQQLVLIGDAARTAHYSIGSGTRLALGDACELAFQLQQCSGGAEIPAALARYQQARMDVSQRIQRLAHRSCNWFDSVEQHAKAPLAAFSLSLMNRCDRYADAATI